MQSEGIRKSLLRKVLIALAVLGGVAFILFGVLVLLSIYPNLLEPSLKCDAEGVCRYGSIVVRGPHVPMPGDPNDGQVIIVDGRACTYVSKNDKYECAADGEPGQLASGKETESEEDEVRDYIQALLDEIEAGRKESSVGESKVLVDKCDTAPESEDYDCLSNKTREGNGDAKAANGSTLIDDPEWRETLATAVWAEARRMERVSPRTAIRLYERLISDFKDLPGVEYSFGYVGYDILASLELPPLKCIEKRKTDFYVATRDEFVRLIVDALKERDRNLLQTYASCWMTDVIPEAADYPSEPGAIGSAVEALLEEAEKCDLSTVAFECDQLAVCRVGLEFEKNEKGVSWIAVVHDRYCPK